MSKKRPNKEEAPKHRWYDFSNSIYPVKVLMFIGGRRDMCDTAMTGLTSMDNPMSEKSAKSLSDIMRERFYDERPESDGEALSVYNDSGNKAFVVRLDGFEGTLYDTALLAHECLHVALAIIDHCGVKEDPPYEALCYLHEAIYRKFLTDAFSIVGGLIGKRCK